MRTTISQAFLLFIILTFQVATAQEWASKRVDQSPRHLEWVTLKSANDRELQTYVAYPERADKAPVFLLIHEIYGHSDWIRLMADELAAQGYLVVAPDLLSGMGPDGGGTDSFGAPAKVRKAVSMLDPKQVTQDLLAAQDYARSLPAGTTKLSVAGFCWGGRQTFRFATNTDVPENFFVFYGSAPTDEEELAKISSPIYGFYAENDARVNATLEKTVSSMKSLGKSFEPRIYEAAGHGFIRVGDSPDADPRVEAARSKALRRMSSIFPPK